MKNMYDFYAKLKEIKDFIKEKNARITLLIDQDDVLADLQGYVLDEYNKLNETNFTYTDITDWNIGQVVGDDSIYQIMFNPDIYVELPVIKDCKEVLKNLIESDLFNIYIVTAAHPAACYNKYKWIKNNLPFFNYDKVIFTSKKYQVKGDILLDDAPHNLEDMKEKGVAKPVCLNKPYNKHVNCDRVNNWADFGIYALEYAMNKIIQK